MSLFGSASIAQSAPLQGFAPAKATQPKSLLPFLHLTQPSAPMISSLGLPLAVLVRDVYMTQGAVLRGGHGAGGPGGGGGAGAGGFATRHVMPMQLS